MTMALPEYVLGCLERLEKAGFRAWAVGGCVRDACLGKTPHDFDLCTDALPEQIQAAFPDRELVLAGVKHGTVGVVTPEGVVEITTLRTEGDYRDGRHPQWVKFVPELREDLLRRDFTINAMAWNPREGLQDPFGGREDLETGILRAVGDPEQRFREDALRILRGVRFAVRFNLTVEENTLAAMETLAPLMEGLSRERVFAELCALLPGITWPELIRFAPVITEVIPEMKPMVGFDQHSPHHAYDLYTHTAHVVGAVPGDLTLRWAALLHDVGKITTFTLDETGRGHFYGHAQMSAEAADAILRRLKAPTALREGAAVLIRHHMTRLEEDKRILKRRVRTLGWETVEQLLQLQEADMGSKGTGEEQDFDQFRRIRALLEKIRAENACLRLQDLAVNGKDMMALGLRGPDIGKTLNALLDAVLEERVPNDREALLREAGKTVLSLTN
ncbi:MAG: HD domain-containing protein [Candidatus Faecousia sp.]|nr:HD domain-containing protein [Clostridiales bacterium]MDY6180738.1 HD domain-containing protein [Candidatus Faecousia sp.]